MKGSIAKSKNLICLSITALSAIALTTAESAKAASFTVAGFTWDSANAVVGGSIVPGSENVYGFNASNFLPNETEVAEKTVGSILGFHPGVSTSVNIGSDTKRGTIELNWGGGKSLANATGKDFVLYENGGFSYPEAFAVAVRKVGQNDFTQFRYEFSEGFESDVFATAFDLSDFGIGEGEEIDAIRVTNLLATDRVSGADGQGFLGGSYKPQTGGWGLGDYTTERFDPDITYAVALHSPKPVPEPSSGLVLLVGGAIATIIANCKFKMANLKS